MLTNDIRLRRFGVFFPAFWNKESILTLYMAISGGVSWIEPLQPLREVR